MKCAAQPPHRAAAAHRSGLQPPGARRTPRPRGHLKLRSAPMLAVRRVPNERGLASLLRRYLTADAVFLLVQHRLLALGDMAAILAGHIALFLTNLMIVVVQRVCLTLG